MKASLLLTAHSAALQTNPVRQALEAAVHGNNSLFTRSSANDQATPGWVVPTHRNTAILFTSHAEIAGGSLPASISVFQVEISDLDPRIHPANFVSQHPFLSSPWSLWIPVYNQDVPILRRKAFYYPNLTTFNPKPSSMLTLDMPIYTLCRQSSNLNRQRNSSFPLPPCPLQGRIVELGKGLQASLLLLSSVFTRTTRISLLLQLGPVAGV